ncbi:MAG: hypothetical protein IJU65_04130 [Desulfovibrio sp.]|nr:hypothetical protein [Desulfovibrio sp.]
MHTEHQHASEGTSGHAPGSLPRNGSMAWYEGPHKDALIYLMVAIFLVELIVGGVAFFYGLMHAAPESPGGPPLARFPWLGWGVAAVLAPVGLLLILHLAGSFVGHMLGREANTDATGEASPADAAQLPERWQRFYAIIRNAPTVVVLLGILLLGAALFFVDGAFSTLQRFGSALTPYIPWLAGSFATVIAVCYLVHRCFMYRHHHLQEEYAYRREVLERTGIVLVDKGSVPLLQQEGQPSAIGAQVLAADALPPAGEGGASRSDTAGAPEETITDAHIVDVRGQDDTPRAGGTGPHSDTNGAL